MSSVQGDQQGWSRHWEVLGRVGLPDYTPDVLWQADILHRAGSHTQRPVSSVGDRRVAAAAPNGGGPASQYPMSQSNPLPARFAVAAAVAQSVAGVGQGNSSGGGGAISLHPRLRSRPAKQPANRSRQPRVPLDSALNLQLVENPELYGPYTLQTQEWTLSVSAPPRSLMEVQDQYGTVPSKGMPGPLRLVLPGGGAGSAALYDSSNGNEYGDHGGHRADGGQLGTALPSLTQSPSGGANERGLAAAAAAVAHADGGGGGDGASGRGAALVSFRIPLPPVPTTPTVRNSPAVAAGPPVLLRSGSGRTGGGGGGVTWSTAPEQELGGSLSSLKPGGESEQQQPYLEAATTAAAAAPPLLQYQAWRPSHGSGGSSGLTARTPPSRKVSADVSYIAYPNLSSPHVQHPYFMQQQQQQSRGKSLSGEPSSAPPRYASSTQRTAAGGLTPRERYKGILERAGRAAVHKQHERRRRRRPGAAAAVAGSAQVRWRKTAGSESDAEGESDVDGNGGDHGAGDDADGGGRPLSPKTYGGLGKWGGRWIQPLAALNSETATARDEPSGKAAATDEGTFAGAAASMAMRTGDVGPAAGSGATPRCAAQQPPAVAAPQAAATAVEGNQTKAETQTQRNEAAARRLGVAERAVWQLRQALDELARFSCANAVRRGMLEDGSVLSQVDARIMALRRYDRVELGPDGRRISVIPPPPPAFPLDAAHEYMAAAQSGVAGLEELEEVVSSMRKKLQVVVGRDTEDLRRAAAEALAEAGHREVSEPGGASETSGPPGPYPVRRPSSGFTLSGASNGVPTLNNFQFQNYQPPSQSQVNIMEQWYEGPSYNTVRVASNTTTVSGMDPTASVTGCGDSVAPGSCRPSYSGGGSGAAAVTPPPPPLSSMPTAAALMWNVQPIRKASSGSVASTPPPSGPGLDPAWSLLESLVIQLQDSHAARIDMMDAFDKRVSTESGGGGVNGTLGLGRGGAAAAALLAATAGAQGAVHNRPHRSRRGGGLERLARLVDVIDEDGCVTGITEMKEAAAEAAVNGNAVRAAVAATLEPKHTEQALYFLAKLSLMLQQDSRLPPDAGFLVAAGVDLLLGEVAWLLALLRCTTGAGSPHLVALAAALRAYEMQRSYTMTLIAVSERLEQAAEEALDRAAIVERQLAATHTALQRANHDVMDMQNNMREMERDMRAVKARNQLLEETVADMEGNLDVVEVAHAARETTMKHADRVAGMLFAEHLTRIKRRSRSVQVASEGDCSDPRAIPPVLQPNSNQYYPITPCVSSRHLNTGAGGSGGAGTTRYGTQKHLSKAHGSRKGGISRSASRRVMRISNRNDVGGSTAAATAAAAALAMARATLDATEDDDTGNVDDAAEHGYDGNNKPRDSYSSASRLSYLKRSGLRTVSWVDRTPRRNSSSDAGQHYDGRISPVTSADGAAAAAADAGAGDGDGNGDDDDAATTTLDAGAVGERMKWESVNDPRVSVEGDAEGRGRSRSPTGRQRRKKGTSPDRQKKHIAETLPTPPPPPPPSHPPSALQQLPYSAEVEEQQQQQQRLRQLQLLQQQQQWGRQGLDGVEYWTQLVSGDGAGSSTGDGAEQQQQHHQKQKRQSAELLQDAALEQAAMDMFSDVFEQKQNGGGGGSAGGAHGTIGRRAGGVLGMA